MPGDALNELKALPKEHLDEKIVLELLLAGEMALQDWKAAAETAKRLCMEAVDEPDFFLSAAFCFPVLMTSLSDHMHLYSDHSRV